GRRYIRVLRIGYNFSLSAYFWYYKERYLFDCSKVLTLTVLETMYRYWKYKIRASLNAELSTSTGYIETSRCPSCR
ncbi:unnamed protein product, partial [Cylicocyclus nassatus]